jgi:hypothetical protein
MKRIITISIILIGVFLLETGPVSAIQLKQLKSIPRHKDSEVKGIGYNNLIIRNDSILTFYNHRWEKRHELTLGKNTKAVISDNALYYCLVEIDTMSAVESDNKFSAFATIYDARQRPIWGISELTEGEYFLSPDGRYLLVATNPTGVYDYSIYIHHQDNPVKKLDIGWFQGLQISNDGLFFITNCGNKGIKIFSSVGSLLTEIKSQKKSQFGSSSEWSGHLAGKHLQIFNKDQKKFEIDMVSPRYEIFTFREDIGRAIMAYGSLMKVVNIENGEILWEINPDTEKSTYQTIDISPDGRLIACGVDQSKDVNIEKSKRHTIGYVYLYNMAGTTYVKRKLTYKNYKEGLPVVKFNPDNSIITVMTADSLHFIESRR